MIGTYIISLLLIGLSGVLLDIHRRSLRNSEQDASLAQRDRRFVLSQYRRRSQASGIIGLLGAGIGLGPLVPHEPLPITLYLVAISGACLSIIILAAIDAWATRQNFARVRSEQMAAQIKLVREFSGGAHGRTENSVRRHAN